MYKYFVKINFINNSFLFLSFFDSAGEHIEAKKIETEDDEMEPTLENKKWMRAITIIQEMDNIVFMKRDEDDKYKEEYDGE